MNSVQKSFCDRWYTKAKVHGKSHSVQSMIDRYISLYICYNSMYNKEIIQRLTGNGDKESATKKVVEYL